MSLTLIRIALVGLALIASQGAGATYAQHQPCNPAVQQCT